MSFRLSRRVRKWPVMVLSLAVVGSGLGWAAADGSDASSPTLFLISPKALAFGYIPIGSTAPSQIITITNVSKHSQTMSGAGGGPGYLAGRRTVRARRWRRVLASDVLRLLAHGQRVRERIDRRDWNGQAFSLNLTGTGTPQFLITPTSLVFGHVKVGTSRARADNRHHQSRQ